MGVNLVTRVRNFAISTQTFTASDHDVQDGCVTPGTHRIMRFDFLSYNAGSAGFGHCTWHQPTPANFMRPDVLLLVNQRKLARRRARCPGAAGVFGLSAP